MKEIRLLRAEEIDARISTCNQYGVGILLYKDARCDMNILDETFGCMNWQRKHDLINGNLFCSVGIYEPDIGWVWKQDVGVESYTEKEKGQASDSFKRACFNWGIGRELYTVPDMFVYARDLNTLKQDDRGKWKCYDYFIVKEIQYEGRKISYVRLYNTKTNKYIEFGTRSTQNTTRRPTEVQIQALLNTLSKKSVEVNEALMWVNKQDIRDITSDEYNYIAKCLKDK